MPSLFSQSVYVEDLAVHQTVEDYENFRYVASNRQPPARNSPLTVPTPFSAQDRLRRHDSRHFRPLRSRATRPLRQPRV